MLVKRAVDREWIPTDYPGIERALFRNNESGGRSSVVRLAQGSHFPTHRHEGTEEVLVLSGMVSLGGVELAQGDYMFTTPGETHDVRALTDAVIFVSSQKATPVVGK
ncbi:cupin domain-containing protein [Noviherbaspirillum galbum]|uniref:Cupin domain-containing protein n=1 Tax=Noviherbaspirillum galbum TaxID=2709383 RepID=A0A6B3SS28_9BURK|nr:cupin domain-containing protein [Noviherbaspirillum galbum]NEX63563.1 cupin domain-containing protein [Noviherbaspirillum galbum]